MRKIIITFNKNDIIELEAVMMTAAEHKKIRNELKELKADFINVDGDSIRAEITGEKVDYSIVEKLEAKGWTFG